MEKMIENYIKMIEDLRVLGDEIVNAWNDMDDDTDAFDDAIEEIENMDMHLECALNILKENA